MLTFRRRQLKTNTNEHWLSYRKPRWTWHQPRHSWDCQNRTVSTSMPVGPAAAVNAPRNTQPRPQSRMTRSQCSWPNCNQQCSASRPSGSAHRFDYPNSTEWHPTHTTAPQHKCHLLLKHNNNASLQHCHHHQNTPHPTNAHRTTPFTGLPPPPQQTPHKNPSPFQLLWLDRPLSQHPLEHLQH